MDTCFHFSWIYTRSGIARSYGNSVNSNPVCKLNHWRSWPTAPFYIPTTSVWGQSLPILTNTCYCLLQLQPCWWVWSGVSWLGFACSWWLMTLSIFSCTGWPCVPLAWGNVNPSPWCILIGSFLYCIVNLETFISSFLSILFFPTGQDDYSNTFPELKMSGSGGGYDTEGAAAHVGSAGLGTSQETQPLKWVGKSSLPACGLPALAWFSREGRVQMSVQGVNAMIALLTKAIE